MAQDEHDPTDPHGEAEALRKANARLLAAAEESAWETAKLITFAQDERDAAIARAEAAEAALAAHHKWHQNIGIITLPSQDGGDDITMDMSLEYSDSSLCELTEAALAEYWTQPPEGSAVPRAPDPVAKAGSGQPGERYQHIKRGTTYQVIGRGKLQTDAPLTDYAEVVAYRCEETGDVWVRPQSEFTPDRFRALPAAPVAEAQPVAWLIKGYGPTDNERFMQKYSSRHGLAVTPLYAHPPVQPTIGGAELDALVAWMRRAYPNDDRIAEAADAITALRAQPDWKAMAERLGEALEKQREVAPKAMRALMEQGRSGLLLADELHKSDDAARAALSDLAKMKGA